MIRNGKDGRTLVIALSLVYLVFSYVIFTNLSGGLVRFVSLLLIIPVPGIVAFLYGMKEGSSLESFLVGFLPVFIFFISGALFGGFEYVPLFSGLFLGACSGVIGYSGTVRRRGEGEWIVFAIIGVLLWIFVMLGGMV